MNRWKIVAMMLTAIIITVTQVANRSLRDQFSQARSDQLLLVMEHKKQMVMMNETLEKLRAEVAERDRVIQDLKDDLETQRSALPRQPTYTKTEQLAWFDERYENTPVDITKNYYKGKGGIKRDDMQQVIKQTLQRLPHAPKTEEIRALLYETFCTESEKGKYVRNKYSRAVGVYQIMPSTAKDTLRFTKNYYKVVYKALNELYDGDQSLEWNLIHNLGYATAMAYTVYWRRVINLDCRANTVHDRAALWKIYYNTVEDKRGSVELYLRQNKK